MPVKFFTINGILFSLVQDFNNTTIDFVTGKPLSPLSKDYKGVYDNSSIGDFIPFIPGTWSIPFTKVFQKNNNNNTWSEVTWITNSFGRNIIDADAFDNNLYILAHNNGSGIISTKFNTSESIGSSGILLTCSGILENHESFLGTINYNTPLVRFIPDNNGSYTPVPDILPIQYNTAVSNDINGFHEFYIYNHPNGPYVIHDQVEILPDVIPPSSIWPVRGNFSSAVDGYVIQNLGSNYYYRTISLSFLQKPATRPIKPSGYTQSIPVQDRDINNPNFKIPIMKDYSLPLTSTQINNKYIMKDISDKSLSRSSVHFITSITYNKSVYILMQVQNSINIYTVSLNNDYYFKTPSNTAPDIVTNNEVCTPGIQPPWPNMTGVISGYYGAEYANFDVFNPTNMTLALYASYQGTPYTFFYPSGLFTRIDSGNGLSGNFGKALNVVTGSWGSGLWGYGAFTAEYTNPVNVRSDVKFDTKTVCGNGLSYAGIKTNMNMGLISPSGFAFCLDFTPYDTTAHLCTQIDLSSVVSNSSNLYVLGDGDDMFIQKPKSKDYRNNKRYSTHSNLEIGGNLFLPLTCRDQYPVGRLYTFILGFYVDGSIGLVDKEEANNLATPIQLIEKPMGRPQVLYNNGKYVISELKLNDNEKLYVSYSDISSDPIYNKVILNQTQQNSFNTMYNTFGKKTWVIGERDVKIEDNLNVREVQ